MWQRPSQNLCKPPICCSYSTPHRRFTQIWGWSRNLVRSATGCNRPCRRLAYPFFRKRAQNLPHESGFIGLFLIMKEAVAIFSFRYSLSISNTHPKHIFTKKKGFGYAPFGGGGGNRTPVRKQLDRNFSGRSLLFTFPQPAGNKHPAGIGSFMMHGTGKAYRTHGHHSNHTRARLVVLPGRMGGLIRLPEQR